MPKSCSSPKAGNCILRMDEITPVIAKHFGNPSYWAATVALSQLVCSASCVSKVRRLALHFPSNGKVLAATNWEHWSLYIAGLKVPLPLLPSLNCCAASWPLFGLEYGSWLCTKGRVSQLVLCKALRVWTEESITGQHFFFCGNTVGKTGTSSLKWGRGTVGFSVPMLLSLGTD